MQLKEMKMLVEYEAVDDLMASKYKDGWMLIALKKNRDNNESAEQCSLELARGGVRKFKTLDAVNSLVKNELYSQKFVVS